METIQIPGLSVLLGRQGESLSKLKLPTRVAVAPDSALLHGGDDLTAAMQAVQRFNATRMCARLRGLREQRIKPTP